VAAPSIAGVPYWRGWDIARGVVILTDGSGFAGGFIVDAWGGLHPFAIGSAGTPPKSPPPVDIATAPYWKGWSIARGVAALPGSNVSGGIVLDGWGAVHPFAFGGGAAPDRAQFRGEPTWPGVDLARGIGTIPASSSGCLPNVAWNARLFDAAHSSRSADGGLTAANTDRLRQIWRLPAPGCPGAPSGGGWLATPVVFHGVIYVGSNFGCLYAINEANGAVRWSKFTAYQPKQTCVQQLGIVSSVNVQDDGSGNPVLYFHSPDGYLYKLNGSDGSTIWRTVVQIPSTTQNDVYAWSSPTVANGKVVIGVSSNCDTPFVQGKVIAYDSNDGHLIWTHKTVPDGFSGAGDWYDAALDPTGNVYVTTGSVTDSQATAHPNTTDGFEQYSLIKLDGTNGNLVWKAPAPKISGDPDYGSSPILFTGNGVPMVGATNKDGWFRAYRQDNGAEVWQALIGTAETNGFVSALAGGLWDGLRLFIASNATRTGGSWAQAFPGAWIPQGGGPAAGSVRALNPATGALIFELPLPSNILGPCSMNANLMLVCAGGHLAGTDLAGHDNGLFIVDTTKPPWVLRHLEDVRNFGGFSQPVQENGAILAGNTDALSKWGP
jgi:outer membrane protein assembly factor BamB